MANGNAWNASFRLGPRCQNVWHINHATWFFAMGVGGALYLNKLLFGIELTTWVGFSAAEVLSFILIGVGGLILIADLGKPGRFLRAMANLRGSWISWGFLADMVFVVGGLIVLLAGGPVWLQWLAGLAALFVIVYPGFVMAASPAIPFWNTPLVPLQFLAYAHATAAALALGFGAGGAAGVVAAAAFTLALACSCLHILGGIMQRGAAKLAADALSRDGLFSAAVVLGVVLPMVAALAESGGARLGVAVWAALALLAVLANWAVKLAVLRSGYYAPLF